MESLNQPTCIPEFYVALQYSISTHSQYSISTQTDVTQASVGCVGTHIAIQLNSSGLRGGIQP